MRALFVAFVAVATASPVLAQDDAPFAGAYAGATVGWDLQNQKDGATILFDRNLDGRFGDTVTTSAGANVFAPGFCGGTARTTAPAGGCRKDKGGISASLRTGYDWQRGPLVYGMVAEIGTSRISDAVSAFSTPSADYVLDRGISYQAALRGRIGVAADRELFYGTAGAAYAGIDHDFRTSNIANGFTERGRNHGWGTQLGGGIEYRMSDRYTIGAEYLHTTLRDPAYRVRAGRISTTPAANPFLLGNAQGTDLRRSDTRFRFGGIRVVGNIRF